MLRIKGAGVVEPVGPVARYHASLPKGLTFMRASKPLLPALMTHFLMGVALGLGFVLLLTMIDIFHVRDLVANSSAPLQTMTVLFGTFALMFGVGAALTGLVLTLEEEG